MPINRFSEHGFGSQLKNFGWMFGVAAISGLIAKEGVITTFSVLAAVIVTTFEQTDEGIEEMTLIISSTGMTWAGAIAFTAFNMLTIPCFAACATAKAELKKGTFKWTLLFWIVASFIGASFVYCFLSMFSIDTLAWAIPCTAVYIALGVLTVFYLRHYERKQDAKVA